MLNPDRTVRERERVREDRYRSAVKQMDMQRLEVGVGGGVALKELASEWREERKGGKK